VLISTPGRPKAPGREHGLPLLRSCGYSSPRPFPRLSNVERVPRTFGKLLFVEAPSVSYWCGLIERRRPDTRSQSGHFRSHDRSYWRRSGQHSVVESRNRARRAGFYGHTGDAQFFCPFLSGFAFSSGLNLSGRRHPMAGLTLLILPRVAHPYQYQAPLYQIAPPVCGEEIPQSA
jgi:hypothetical protein